MWYRRITEFKDVDPPPAIKITRPSPQKVQFGQNAFQGLAFGPKPPSKFPPISAKRKLKAAEIVEDDIACFKRVRLVTSKERVRFIPGPFRQVRISGQGLSLDAAMRYKLEESNAWDDFQILKQTLGPSHPDTLASLGCLIRILYNVRKSSTAEEILTEILKTEEQMLVEQSPELLRILMGNLMTTLVAQKKIDAAEELWSRATALFLAKASQKEHGALLRVFELAHPFRMASSPQSIALGAILESTTEEKGEHPPQRQGLTEWQEVDLYPASSKRQQEKFTELLSKFVTLPEPEGQERDIYYSTGQDSGLAAYDGRKQEWVPVFKKERRPRAPSLPIWVPGAPISNPGEQRPDTILFSGGPQVSLYEELKNTVVENSRQFIQDSMDSRSPLLNGSLSKEGTPPSHSFSLGRFLSQPSSPSTGSTKEPYVSHALPSLEDVPDITEDILDIYSGKSHVCPKCSMKFTFPSGLTRHINLRHPFIHIPLPY